MAATFHPQVYRGQQQHTHNQKSGDVSINGTFNTHAQQTPSAPSSSDIAVSQKQPSYAQSSHNASYASEPSASPSFGLQHPQSYVYPPHPASTQQLQFKRMSVKQYAELARGYAGVKCREEVLFPWLHGADFAGTQQAANFGFVNGNRARAPRFRALTTIAAHGIRPELELRDAQQQASIPHRPRVPTSTSSISTRSSTDSLSSSGTGVSRSLSASSSTDSSESASSDGLSSAASSAPSSVHSSEVGHKDGNNVQLPAHTGPEPHPALLTSAWLPSELIVHIPSASIEQSLLESRFHTPVLPTPGISFRHYRLQANKMASISDIVVYADKGGFCREAIEVAKRCRAALNNCERARRVAGECQVLSYDVYVIDEPFHVFEEEYPYLVGVDSAGYAKNNINFAEREHEEMQAFTGAIEICENVFLGNSFDVPLPLDERAAMSPNLSAGDKAANNPFKFSVCVEARDMAHMADLGQLRARERHLDDVQQKRVVEAQEAQRLEMLTGARKYTNHQSGASYWYSSSDDSSYEGTSSSGSTSSTPTSSDSEMTDDDDGQLARDLSIATAIRHSPRKQPTSRHYDVDEDTSDYEEFFDASDKENFTTDVRCGNNGIRSPPRSPGKSAGRLARAAPSLALSSYVQNARLDDAPSKIQLKRHSRTLSALASNAASALHASITGPKSPSGRSAKSSQAAAKSLASAQRRHEKRARRTLDKAARSAARRVERQEAAEATIKQAEPEQPEAQVLHANLEEIVHLETMSTGQSLPNPMTQTVLLVDAIVEHVVWLRTQARPHLRSSLEQRASSLRTSGPNAGASKPDAVAGGKILPRRILIHCVDGYTDSSLLALAYIMYDRVVSLPQAYLYLQNDRQRSFFVYPSDVAILGALEKRLLSIARLQGRAKYNDDLTVEQIAEIDRRDREERERANMATAVAAAVSVRANGSGVSAVSQAKSAMTAFLPRPSLFSRSSSNVSAATIRAGVPLQPSHAAPAANAYHNASLPDGRVLHPWFYDSKWDGHFPSRILDHVYLGNLDHAGNPGMLKELGITHVLSIGESALTPPSAAASLMGSRAATPANSLWHEHRQGRINVLDVQDIQDDGVDSILPHIVNAVEYIEAAQRSGSKVLVHCRVGVSRSATLVVAYVMHALDKSLADAYLMVRARRLNILIQPTILFMWTLHTWEEEIRGSAIDEQNNLHPTRAARLTWPILATEIADLNQKYLGC